MYVVMTRACMSALLLRAVVAYGPPARISRAARASRAARGPHRSFVSANEVDVKAADVNPVKWSEAMTLPYNDDNGNLLRIRHSTAHVMAMAVQKLFKGTKGADCLARTLCPRLFLAASMPRGN